MQNRRGMGGGKFQGARGNSVAPIILEFPIEYRNGVHLFTYVDRQAVLRRCRPHRAAVPPQLNREYATPLCNI